MKKFFLVPATILSVASLAGNASGSVITTTFGPFVTGGAAPFDEATSVNLESDGVNAIVATPDLAFQATGAGVGIQSTGEGPSGTPGVDITNGETWSLTFDQGGTLDNLQITLIPLGSAGFNTDLDLTFTTASSSSTVTVTTGTSTTNDLIVPVGLSFDANEVITITREDAVPAYRFEAITVTVPEPGSLALAGLGGATMLLRRRKA